MAVQELPEGAKARLGKGRISGNIAYSPDGMLLAVGSSIGIWIYDVQTGQELDLITGHKDWITSVAFSPDSRTLASGSLDNTVRLWDVNTGSPLRTLMGHTDRVYSVTFSPDGNALASGSRNGEVHLWDAVTGRNKATLIGHESSINNIVYSPDGRTLASGGYNAVCLWDVNTKLLRNTITFRAGYVNVTFSPDGNTIATRSELGKVQLWDAVTGKLKNTFEATSSGAWGRPSTIVYSPDGATIASSGNNFQGEGRYARGVRLWDAVSGRLKITLAGHKDDIYSVAYSPDGTMLVSASYTELYFWDAATGQLKQALTGHENKVFNIAYSPDGSTLASGSYNTIRLWDTTTGQLKAELVGRMGWVFNIAYSPDGSTLASGSGDTIYLWDANIGQLKFNFVVGFLEYGNVNSVAYSPDGGTLASGIGNTIGLWNTSQLKATLKGHTDYVNSVAYSPDGGTLASGSDDATISLWNANTGQLKATFATFEEHTRRIYSVVYSPDGGTLGIISGKSSGQDWRNPNVVIDSQSTISLWDANTGQLRVTFEEHTDHVKSIAFSPDGQVLASAGDDNTIRLWNTTTGQSKAIVEKHTSTGVYSIAFSPDGTTLASGGLNGTVLLWEITPTSSEPESIAEDVNKDGVVNIIDLTVVASNFGKTGQNAADVNGDGVVNIIDLTLVAAAFGNTAAAPEIWIRPLDSTLARAEVEAWLREARLMNLTDPAFQRGIAVLEQLLAAFAPKETALLPNYPNPFNPETWIPYQLASPADVSISIYAVDGTVVRTLSLGHQLIGMYHQRSRAAYWDGKNTSGESVASGVYFYTLTADDFTATRKMLIRK